MPPEPGPLNINIVVQASGLRLCSRDGCTTTAIFMGAIHGAFGAAPKRENGRSASLALQSGRMPLLRYFLRSTIV
jgi:hypothetical protein